MSIHTFPFAAAGRPTITVRRELDRLFDDAFAGRGGTAQPATDARESATSFSLTLDLPGVAPESLEVLAEDGVLTVKGSRSTPPLSEGERALFSERANGALTRRFRLPKSADLQSIQATYTHGVLTLTIAKVAPAQPRKVAVNVTG